MSFAVRPIGLASASNFIWRPTISADVTNYNLKAAAIAAGWDGVVPLDAIVTVNSGIVLSADSTSQYGFDTGSGFPAGTTLKLIMPGYVCGMGGSGGNEYPNGGGGPGGTALRAQFAITIDALGGVIAGGGGGGSNGASGYGGGGGRTGRINSAKGTGDAGVGTFSSGGKGASAMGGAGGTTGPGGVGSFTGGGGGGGWGAAGGKGAASATPGAGGAAVVGNSYITWINTGTRYGAIT